MTTGDILPFFRKVLLSGFVRVSHGLFEMITTVLLARLMTVESVGIYSSSYALATVISVAAAAGLPVSLVRLIPQLGLRSCSDMVRGCFLWAYAHVIAVAVIVASFAAFLPFLLSHELRSELSTYFLTLFLVPALVMAMVQRGLLQGSDNVVVAQVPEFLLKPLLFAALLSFSLLLDNNSPLAASGAMILQIICAMLAALFGLILVSRIYSRYYKPSRPGFMVKTWYVSSFAFAATQLTALLTAQIGIIVLPLLSGPSETGLFKAAFTLAMLVSLPLIMVNAPLPPAVARLYEAGDLGALQKLVTVSARTSSAMTLAIGGLLIWEGDYIIQLLFGSDFEKSYVSLVILVVGQIVSVSSGSVAFILQMSGLERISLRYALVSLLMQLILVGLFASNFGAIGASIAFTISSIFLNLGLARVVYRRLGLDPTFLGLASR